MTLKRIFVSAKSTQVHFSCIMYSWLCRGQWHLQNTTIPLIGWTKKTIRSALRDKYFHSRWYIFRFCIKFWVRWSMSVSDVVLNGPQSKKSLRNADLELLSQLLCFSSLWNESFFCYWFPVPAVDVCVDWLERLCELSLPGFGRPFEGKARLFRTDNQRRLQWLKSLISSVFKSVSLLIPYDNRRKKLF